MLFTRDTIAPSPTPVIFTRLVKDGVFQSNFLGNARDPMWTLHFRATQSGEDDSHQPLRGNSQTYELLIM